MLKKELLEKMVEAVKERKCVLIKEDLSILVKECSTENKALYGIILENYIDSFEEDVQDRELQEALECDCEKEISLAMFLIENYKKEVLSTNLIKNMLTEEFEVLLNEETWTYVLEKFDNFEIALMNYRDGAVASNEETYLNVNEYFNAIKEQEIFD